MSQPIDVGAVLGGRYKVTELVLTSADGDAVLGGMDQVLNRSVSILVASPENASQVATSAREIATGERYGTMQVLDLGISDGSTYLITNTASPADLLDLVIQRDAPFIEPFYTDTLGSEIFGVTRSAEPEVYDDEEEYWEELQANEERNVGGRVAKKLTGFTSRWGRGRKDSASPEADEEAEGFAAAADEAAATDAEDHEPTDSAPPTAAANVPPRPQI
ncbi:MAG: ABC transporter substrate-binding protein, partial [Micrococcaceae bacterium]|nr:ABC transporter substrate-binding protein [Micrococcaceae bacterium]MDN5906397.1 ABC transporter substrate-binding protein [Micrococcaceae bacterium]